MKFSAENIGTEENSPSSVATMQRIEEFFESMHDIQFGWVDAADQIHDGIPEIIEAFRDMYRLQSPQQLDETRYGLCFDQVEYERAFFVRQKIEHVTVYLEMDNEEKANHTFLIFVLNETQPHIFEHADVEYRGIWPKKSIPRAIREMIDRMEVQYAEYGYKVHKTITYPQPPYGIGYDELLQFMYEHE